MTTIDEDSFDYLAPENQLNENELKIKFLLKEGFISEALKCLYHCMCYSRVIYGKQSVEHSKYVLCLAFVYIEHKDLIVQAKDHAEAALNILNCKPIFKDIHNKHCFDTKPIDDECVTFIHLLLMAYYILGKSYLKLNEYILAEKSTIKARCLFEIWPLKNIENKYGNDGFLTNSTEFDLNTFPSIYRLNLMILQISAKISIQLHKNDIAKELYHICIEQIFIAKNRETSECIPIYQNLGKIYLTLADEESTAQAITFYEKAVNLAIRLSDDVNTDVVVFNANYLLALALRKWNDCAHQERAKLILESGLSQLDEINPTSTGPILPFRYLDTRGHVERSSSETRTPSVTKLQQMFRTELARIYLLSERAGVAIRLLEANLRFQEEHIGEWSKDSLRTRKFIGTIHLSCGHLDQALKEIKKCLIGEELVFGPKSEQVIASQAMIQRITC